MMVSDTPFTTMVSLMTEGSAPRRESQKEWLRTATGWAPMVSSSLGDKSRPLKGVMPNMGKYEPDTSIPCPFSVWFRKARLTEMARCAAMPENRNCVRSKSRKMA